MIQLKSKIGKGTHPDCSDFLMMGEGYHNNHHKHSNRANFGVKWYEIDITYQIIKILDAIKLIRLKNVPV